MRIIRLAACSGIIMFAMATMSIRIEAQAQTYQAQAGSNGVVEIQLELEGTGHSDETISVYQCEECGESVTRKEYGVPLLSNIPYVSRLFKNVGISGCDCVKEEPAQAEVAVAEDVVVYAAPVARAATASYQVGQAKALPSPYYLNDDVQYFPAQPAPSTPPQPNVASQQWVPENGTWQANAAPVIYLQQSGSAPPAPYAPPAHYPAPRTYAAPYQVPQVADVPFVASNVASSPVAPSTNCQGCPTSRCATAVAPATTCGTHASASQLFVEKSCSNSNGLTASIDLRPCTKSTTVVAASTVPADTTSCGSSPCACKPCKCSPCTSTSTALTVATPCDKTPCETKNCQATPVATTTCPSTPCQTTTCPTTTCPSSTNTITISNSPYPSVPPTCSEQSSECNECPSQQKKVETFTLSVAPQPPCCVDSECSESGSCGDCPACPGAASKVVIGHPLPPSRWTSPVPHRIAFGFAAHPPVAKSPESISPEMAKLMAENAHLSTKVEMITAMAELNAEYTQQRANDKAEMMEAYAELQSAYLGQIAESQVEIARLQAGLEMAEGMQEIWGEMMELQAQNVALTARLEMSETREVKKAECEPCDSANSVQNFHKFAQEMQKQLAAKEAENESLRKRIAEMEAQVKALAERQTENEIR